MRRSTVLLTTSSLAAVALTAYAGSVAHTSDTQWGSYTSSNIDKGPTLDLTTVEVEDAAAVLYRQPWDDANYRVEIGKDDGTRFSADELCLDDQTFSATETILVNGNRYRGGIHTIGAGANEHEAAIADGVAIPLPATLDTITDVRFVTAGAKQATANYTVTFSYADATPDAAVVVPILAASTLVGRAGSGTNYTKAAYTGLTNNANASADADALGGTDCGGNGADEVIVTNPNPTALVDAITFGYQTFAEADAACTGCAANSVPWLGGPLAVTLTSTQDDLEATFLYTGTITSPNTAGTAIDAGSSALWHQVSWLPTPTVDGGIFLTFACNDDPTFPGWPTGAEMVDLSQETSPYTFVTCDGRYGRYELEFVAEFDVSPTLTDLTLTYDADADNDGYGVDGATGGQDCNDADATKNPAAIEVVADGIDQDCSGGDLCYLDTDNDGDRDGTATIVSADLSCTGANEAVLADPIDCAINNAAISSTDTEIPGDLIDQTCDGKEVCYTDGDGDGFGGTGTTVAGDMDCSDVAESTTNTDCNDGNVNAFPGAAILAIHVGDGIDRDCDTFEECYTDADKDGFGTATIKDDDGDGTCTSVDGESTVNTDCNDTLATISPGDAEIVADGIDQDCDAKDTCYQDLDLDAYGTATLIDSLLATCISAGESAFSTDCDDADNTANPGVSETIGNGNDNNCDGSETCYDDADNDNARSSTNTRISSTDEDCADDFEGASGDDLDCDETDPTQFPDNVETTGNGVDNDCNGVEICFADLDNDDFRTTGTVNSTTDEDCADSTEALSGAGLDCDDLTSTTNPAAADVCGDGVDNDCDDLGDNGPLAGVVDGWLDDDGDGLDFSEEETLGTDDCDSDSDGDGLEDGDEIAIGTDPNLTDSDGDGASDLIEVVSTATPLNTDGDATIDALDTDDDNDGVLTSVEDLDNDDNLLEHDTDLDLIPDFRDTDDDGDTISTFNEDLDGDGNRVEENTDGDALPNYRDADDDGDGLLTRLEDVEFVNGDPLDDDTDNDGTADYRDTDDDGDGVLTDTEDLDNDGIYTDEDTDGDLTPNWRDTDDDGDGIATLVEGTGAGDADGVPNYLDTDSDGDTFLDSVEGVTNSDTDATADYLDLDSDNDTVLDSAESKTDSDSDSLQNRVDPDDDGDGILTSAEQAFAAADADGVANYLDLDSDGDTWTDAYEFSTQIQADKDQDDDSLDDYVDTDSDGDTVLDVNELGDEPVDFDSDGDGLKNRLDSDDDGDTVLTASEDKEFVDGNPLNDDTDNDGTVDYLDTDDDNDTVLTRDESPDGDGNPLDDNTDGDALLNYLDTDDDGDGVLTANESPDGDGNPLDDNSDGDASLNYLDVDDDGDGINTSLETSADFDLDLTPNHLDTDSDGDGFLDATEGNVDSELDLARDYLDLDSDNDEVADADENGGRNKPAAPLNTDGDALNDRIDSDDDGDTIPTKDEEPESNDANPKNDDWDNDTVADYLDTDDDNDTVLTKNEDLDVDANPKDDNTDADALANYLDTDDDGDGELTASESPDGDANPLDDDSDGDTAENWIDADDDGDGIPTLTETAQFSRNVDADTVENHLDTDSDGDNWLDSYEWTELPGVTDYDGDTKPDFVDTDSDADEVLDRNEGTSAAPIDTDLDGFEDRIDEDDDDDSLPTASEEPELNNGNPLDDDTDGDGVADFRDEDDDGDSIWTVDEDTDGDGDLYDNDHDFDSIDDYLDDDDDNDTVLTIDEAPDGDGDPLDDDTDADNDPDYLDNDDDNDTQLTASEKQPGGHPLDWDLDGDGAPNFLDADDDDDGVDSFCELSFGALPLLTDSDGDTFSDGEEWLNSLDLSIPLADYADADGQITGTDCLSPWNRDSDVFINALDIDDDGDNMLTTDEGGADDDCPAPGIDVPVGDGIPNYLDRDSDGDLLEDDLFGDGQIVGDGQGDVDLDFIQDFIDCDNAGCAGDSDQDGIANCDEYDTCPFPDVTDCSKDEDIDDDGVLDGDEIGTDPGCFDAGLDGGAECVGQDTDGDGEIDLLDLDDDGDGFLTDDETGLVCADGTAATLVFDVDALAWTYECADGTVLSGELQNTDEDSGGAYPQFPDETPDYLDADDDGDGKDSIDEGDGDVDADGVVNYLDPNDGDGPTADADADGMTNLDESDLGLDPYSDDSDGDGIPDAVEIGDPSSPTNTDGDALIDAADDDDDDDGIPTATEGALDADDDGTANYLDLDSDEDGKPDADEGVVDTDGDGVADFVDADDEDGPLVAGGDSGAGSKTLEYAGCQCNSAPSPMGGAWLVGLLGLLGLRRRSSR